jgi:hypothetical protein
MGSRLRLSVVLLALVACACSVSAQAPARQPALTTDVVYGHKDGLALTFDVYRPAQPNGVAGHAFSGADLERANAAMVQWFERHLGSAAK